MKKSIITLLALLALTVTGCEGHKIDKGVVVNKSMTPVYTSFIFNGKVMVPIVHPASYRVSVKDKGIVETFYVNEDKYSTLSVGDSISFTTARAGRKEKRND